MQENMVVVSRCVDYQDTNIKTAVKNIFDLMGSITSFVSPGNTVVIKPNMLLGKKPEDVVTTHPNVIRYIIKELKKVDCNIVLGDSPGGPFTEGRLKSIYKKTGFYDLAEEENIELNYNTGYTKVSFTDGLLVKSFQICDFIREADLVINMSKLKTHSFMRYTGSVKNLFGTIPGMKKAEYHLRMSEAENFALMLVDLARFISPQLNIMDAVVGMEGAGPSAGDKRKFNYLMASPSCFALDVAGAYLFNVKPTDIPTINQAAQKGLIGNFAELDIQGDQIIPAKNTKIPEIDHSDTRNIKGLPPFLANIVNKLLKPRPVFDEEKCVQCGVCADNCPTEAIELTDYPVVDLNGCIRCYCCQELCSYQAVKIKKPLLGKLFF